MISIACKPANGVWSFLIAIIRLNDILFLTPFLFSASSSIFWSTFWNWLRRVEQSVKNEHAGRCWNLKKSHENTVDIQFHKKELNSVASFIKLQKLSNQCCLPLPTENMLHSHLNQRHVFSPQSLVSGGLIPSVCALFRSSSGSES